MDFLSQIFMKNTPIKRNSLAQITMKIASMRSKVSTPRPFRRDHVCAIAAQEKLAYAPKFFRHGFHPRDRFIWF